MKYITCSLKCGTPLEKEILWLDRRQKAIAVLGGHLTILGITSCGDTILEEVEGFSPFMVSPPKSFVSLVSGDVLMLLLCLLFSQ